MTIPKTIKIGGKTFEVRLEDEEAQRHGNSGFASIEFQLIMLREVGCCQERKEQVLLHEILHHVDNIYQIRDDGKDFSEAEIARLSEALYQVLKDNKLSF